MPRKLGGGRGLSMYTEFTDTYGARIELQTSSAACAPRCWLRIKGGEVNNPKGEIKTESGRELHFAAHLSLAQAKRLRKGLDKWITDAEAGKL